MRRPGAGRSGADRGRTAGAAPRSGGCPARIRPRGDPAGAGPWGGGATPLYVSARQDRAAGGARPRREMFRSGPASLTPSERRIAEIAAAGQTNREIARTLFVTPKTVEYHLRNAYRKLGIETRRELADVLIT